ncbi:MAG TPA: hypothetical protein VFY99_08785 [Solirubrobacterales bacterium]
MDLRKLDAGEIIAGVAGIGLIASMALLDWFGVDVPPGTEPIEGFDAFRAFDVVDILLLLLALAAIALPVTALGSNRTDVPTALSALLTLAAIVAALVLAYRIIDTPDLSGDRFALDRPPFNIGFETTVSVGAFVGLAATLAIAVGGWLSMRDDGTRG